MTSWLKRFLYNLRAIAKGTKRRKGILSGSEIAEAERMWIRSSHDELKSSKLYKDLALKLKLVENDGLLRCKGRLECSDLGPHHPSKGR